MSPWLPLPALGSCTLWRSWFKTPGHQLSLSILRALAESWCSFTGINWSITSLTSQASPSISNSFLKMYHVYHKPDHYHSLPHVKQQIHKKYASGGFSWKFPEKPSPGPPEQAARPGCPAPPTWPYVFPHSEGHDMMVSHGIPSFLRENQHGDSGRCLMAVRTSWFMFEIAWIPAGVFISKTGKQAGCLADKALRTKESPPGDSSMFGAGCPSQGHINVTCLAWSSVNVPRSPVPHIY